MDFILNADHGSNASSFANSVTVGKDANLDRTVVTALATRESPAHGVAEEDLMNMLKKIGKPDNAGAYLKSKRKNTTSHHCM